MTEEVSKSKLFLARLVVVLMVAFVFVGLAQHGFSAEVRARVWQDLLERASGPMTFCFILQLIMATTAAFLGGVKDARRGRAPFLRAVLFNPAQRAGRPTDSSRHTPFDSPVRTGHPPIPRDLQHATATFCADKLGR